MAFRARLGIALLLLGIAALGRAHAVLSVSQAEGEKKAETVEGLKDIQQRLLNLEKMLVRQHEFIDSQLKTLQLKLDDLGGKRQGSDVMKDLLSAVYGEHFKMVEERLVELGDKAPITDLVHELFSGSDCNFDTLIKLAHSLSNPSLSNQILSALYEEVKKTNHKDMKNLIALAKAFESEVLQQVNHSEAESAKVNTIVEQLREEIVSEASKVFIAAMLSGKDYKNNLSVVATGAALEGYRSSVAAAVMQRTVEGAFYAIDFTQTLEAINTHASLWQRIAGMDALKDQLHRLEVASDFLDVQIASYLSGILNQTEYAFLDPAMQTTAEALVAKLPLNIRNLFFLPTFCIYSKLQDAYLIASNSHYDSERRNVLTAPRSKSGDLPAGASWRVKLINHKLFFDNIDFPGENIYAALIDYDKRTHYVFGWIPGNNTDPQSAWIIQSEDESLLLRNVHFTTGEYLYASDTLNIVTGNKFVFSLQKKNAENRLGFLWQITDC